MALSKDAQKAYKKAEKAKRKSRRRGRHWFFLQKGDTTKEIISKLFTQLAALIFIICIVILFDYFAAMFINSRNNSFLQNLYTSITGEYTEGDLLPSAKELLQLNPDTVGWIKIDGTKVDLPVVLRNGAEEGNTYYLTRNFYGSKAKAGTVFVDYRTTVMGRNQSENIVMYGHNEADNTMFGDLDRYKTNIEFYKEHPTIKFNTNYEEGEYKIFAYFVTNVTPEQSADGTVFDYHNYIDMDRSRFDEFIKNIQLRNQIITPVDVKYGDKIITLSTCSSEFEPSRFVVFARKVRKGEDTSVDVASAVLNPNAKEPDWDVIYGR